ncbi:MAG: hypothetical protein ABIG43_03395, partial [Chloroflexota bacterium]
WTVTWTVTTVTVAYVDLYIPEMNGFFEYEVTPEQAAAGEAQFDMVQSDTLPPVPPVDPCLCSTGDGSMNNPGGLVPCPCYVEAPTLTTETMGASVGLVGGEGEVGVPVGGIGLHWAGCGDGYCWDGENSFTCPGDCPVVCGNLTCENGENHSTCPGDCRTAVCGNAACESGENSSTCPGDCRSELPVGFPSTVPYGNYTQSCIGSGLVGGQQSTISFSNTDINQFSQQVVGNIQTALQQVCSSVPGSECTCDSSFTFTPWNGTYFTMTFNFSVTCCADGYCTPMDAGWTCTITADQ